MSDVNHINILFTIALSLMLEAEKQQVKIPQSIKKQLDGWFAKKTRIETETPVSAELSTGFNLFNLISGKLKTEASIRDEIKREFERNISDLVARLNEIAATIQSVTKRDILVIIDDLDKLDLGVVKPIFQDHIKALFSPGFQIIFTIPIASLRESVLRSMLISESDDQIVEMHVTKLFSKGERRQPNAIPHAAAEDTLCEILQKRFASAEITDEILEAETAKQIVRHSGGVLRELIRIANICCRICLRQIRHADDPSSIMINSAILEAAIQEIRLDFETPLGKADYEILQSTYRKFAPEDPKAQAFLDLLHGLHILEYRNAEVWYDVHPIVEDLLKRKGLD